MLELPNDNNEKITVHQPANQKQLKVMRNMQFFAELLKIAHALETNAIPYIALKGGAYLNDIYPLGERFLTDIDILVKRKDLEWTKDVLKTISYTYLKGPYPQSASMKGDIEITCLNQKANIAIDLHFALVHGNRRAKANMHDDALFNNVRRTPDHGICVLSHEDALWFIIEHSFNDGLSRGANRENPDLDYLDFKRYVNKYGEVINWRLFLTIVKERRLSNACGLFLRKLVKLYHVTIPEYVLQEVKANSATKAIYERCEGYINPFSKDYNAIKNTNEQQQKNIYRLAPKMSIRSIVCAFYEDTFSSKMARLRHVLLPPIMSMKKWYGIAPEDPLPRLLYLSRLVSFIRLGLQAKLQNRRKARSVQSF
jgi:hypothetical protein